MVAVRLRIYDDSRRHCRRKKEAGDWSIKANGYRQVEAIAAVRSARAISAVLLCLLSLAELVMQVIGVKEVDESRAGGE